MVPRDSLEKFKSTAQTAAVTATLAAAQRARKARFQLDQALLDLQHSRLPSLKQKITDVQIESTDLVQRLGRGVLERAQEVRATLVQSMLTPAWLREISKMADRTSGAAEGVSAERTVEFTPMAPEFPSGLAREIADSLDRLIEMEEAQREQPQPTDAQKKRPRGSAGSARKSRKNQA